MKHSHVSATAAASRLALGWLVCAVVAGCSVDPATDPSAAAPDPSPALPLTLAQDEPAARARPSRFDPLIAGVEADLARSGASGIAVAVIEHGQLSFARGFGTKAPGSRDPVTARTLFHIGSTTKMMTATAVLQQVAAGRVDLSAPVTRYVPGFHFDLDPSWAPSIRVRDLLTHTSGMLDYLVVDVPQDQKQDSALLSFMTGEFGARDYLMVTPGTFWNYTNPGYYLAGLIAEQIAGQPYRAVMKRRIFDPLCMTRTFFLGSEVLADGDYAIGANIVDPSTPAQVRPDTYDNAWARPAGYTWSNVFDMAKFAVFLMNGDDHVLRSPQRTAMQSPQVNMQTALDLQSYGYGLVVQRGLFVGSAFYDTKLVWHDGEIPGYSALMLYLPALQFGFVALANTDAVSFNNSWAAALATLAHLPAPVPPPDLSVDRSRFPSYAGVYVDSFIVGDITVTSRGSELTIDAPGLAPLGLGYDPVLVPFTPDNFLLTLRDPATGAVLQQLPITFLADASGQMRYLRARAFVAIRPTTPAPSPTRSLAAPALSTAEREARVRALRRPQLVSPFGPPVPQPR